VSVLQLKELIILEEELRRKVIKRAYQEELAGAQNQFDRDLALARRNRELEKVDEESAKKRTDALKDLEEAQ
jgi:hypothetical protein